MNVMPFLVYFIENVYNKIENTLPQPDTIDAFHKALDEGRITERNLFPYFCADSNSGFSNFRHSNTDSNTF